MRILYITHYEKLYGANLSLLQLIEQERKLFADEILVLVNKEGAFTDELQRKEIKYIKCRYFTDTVNVKKKFVLLKIWFKKFTKFFINLRVYIKIKKYGHFDIIHTNSSVINIGYYLAKKMKAKHVWHIREFGYDDYNLQYILPDRQRRMEYEKSDAIIAISQSIEKEIYKVSPKANCKVIYNGVNQGNEIYNKVINPDNIRFCIVGNICEKKNQFEAVKACKILKETGINNFSLYIWGDGDETYIRKIMMYIEKHSLGGTVKFQGYSSDIMSRLKDMNVGIVPSVREAFGRVTIEFMSNYMPVIGTDSGGTLELVEHMQDGIIYPLNDVKALSDAMLMLIQRNSLIESMGKLAKEKSLNFTAKINAVNIHKLYEGL